MMAKNTSILLGEHFEEYISKKFQSGSFSSASEVVRTALRLMEAEDKKQMALVTALVKGEKSGRVEDFDPKSHLEKLHKKYQ
jgi:antitoxin ParD1/3/4